MKKKIEIYKSVTVLDKEFEIELPEDPYYYRNSFYREYFAVFPQFANWPNGDGSIWKYDFIKIIDGIGDGCIKYDDIPVSEFANILQYKKEDTDKYDVVDYIVNHFGDEQITKERFEEVFECMVNNMKNLK